MIAAQYDLYNKNSRYVGTLYAAVRPHINFVEINYYIVYHGDSEHSATMLTNQYVVTELLPQEITEKIKELTDGTQEP